MMGKLALFASDDEIPEVVLERVDIVLSDRELGIGEVVSSHREEWFLDIFEEEGVSRAVALGYRRLFSGQFLERTDVEMYNIHPSLLPRFKGLDVYRRVLKSDVDVSGATLHEIVEEMDEGEVIDRIRYDVPEDSGVKQFRYYSREYQKKLFRRNF